MVDQSLAENDGFISFRNPHSEIQTISKGGGIFNSYLFFLPFPIRAMIQNLTGLKFANLLEHGLGAKKPTTTKMI